MSRLLLALAITFSWTTQAVLSSETASTEKVPAEYPQITTGPQRVYNPGKVLTFPKFSGESIADEQTLAFKPTQGNSVVLIFVASWCEPCQILMPELKQLARKHESESNKVFFVFSHDTKTDAAAFAKEHKLAAPAIMANADILTDFKNPELPSVYVGDKWGYLADRFIRLQKSDVDKLDSVIAKITAL